MADINETLNNLNKTNDSTGSFDQDDINNNKVMAVLAYLSWLLLIPLLAAKESKFARFHCNQGLVLAIFGTLVPIVCGILDGIPLIGWVFGIISGGVGLVITILSVIGIVNAINGKAKDVPIIGNIRILK